MQLLEGLRVLDLSMHLAGPYCTMVLADMGAEVLKVEPPGGDPMRRLLPAKDGVSLLFAAVNRNKRSVAIDLREPEGLNFARELIGRADVLFNNYRTGVMDRLGLAFADVIKVNPRIVYCSLTGYGQTGPRKDHSAFDIAVQAMSGGMSLTGHPGGPPARAGIPIADLAGGMFAAIGILGAVRKRHVTGEAVELDLSLLDGQISMLTYWAAITLNTGEVPGPQGSGNAQMVPSGAFRASDGYVAIAPLAESFWPKVCAAVGRPDLAQHEDFETLAARIAHREALDAELAAEIAKKTTAEWVDRFLEFDVPCSPINDVRAAMDEPQVLARNMRISVESAVGTLGFAGNPIKTMPDTDGPVLPPPELNEHEQWARETWLDTPEAGS